MMCMPIKLRQWTSFLKATPVNEMMSEDPTAEAPILFSMINHSPSKMFSDVLARCFSGYDIVSGSRVRAPTDLAFYTVGTMCTDFSCYNLSNPKQYLGTILLTRTALNLLFSDPFLPTAC